MSVCFSLKLSLKANEHFILISWIIIKVYADSCSSSIYLFLFVFINSSNRARFGLIIGLLHFQALVSPPLSAAYLQTQALRLKNYALAS